MRKLLGSSGLLTCCSVRGIASYGKTALSHAEVVAKFQAVEVPSDGAVDELSLLETVEERMRGWRLNRWEHRVPVLSSQSEKEAAQSQLHTIKSLILDHAKTHAIMLQDMDLVCTTLKVSPEDLRTKTRAWLQEEIAKMRWNGDVAQAKAVRDAFVRLEQYGSRDFKYFERLCSVYGLAKLGTFDDAFSHVVVPKQNSIALDTSSPFHNLMAVLVRKYPTLDLVFDFLGFNEVEGYRASLGRYLTLGLESKYATATSAVPSSRVLFQHDASLASREVLFDYGNSARSVADSTEGRHGVADFVHVRGNDITLITIVSPNRWLRSRQIANPKQLEGIARRSSFVFGMPYDAVRIRNLLLPPSYLDRVSLDRINRHVLALDPATLQSTAPWISMYAKELDVARDADYAQMTKVKPEEEWVKL
mmetsp:Transcript_15045/g.17348  ORF Transcript_15045/g.17348 Transcript_15045/m.17348 type:complete len:419 (-) Transcript_15045:159-1415(-)